MARRKSRARQEAELIQSLLGLSAIGGFFVTYYFTESINASLVVGGSLIVLVIAILIIQKKIKTGRNTNRLKRSGIADIDQMDGIQFEHYLKHLLKAQGYSVTVTQAAGDYGADLVIKKGGNKIVVQAKRHSKNVGIEAVQQIAAAKSYYGATDAWVLSNRDYTKAASNLAAASGVRLIGREEFIQMIVSMNPDALLDPKQVMEDIPPESNKCNRCGHSMILRKGARGIFWGCSTYPKCTNTKAQ